MRRLINRLAAVVATLVLLVTPMAGITVHASADPTITEYPAGSQPTNMTTAPDGTVWYTQIYSHINHIDASGNVTTYTIPSPTSNSGSSVPSNLTVANDGNVWVTLGLQNYIAKVDPATSQVTTYALQSQGSPNASTYPNSIKQGSDGAMWFTEASANAIGRITNDGAITIYPLPNADSLPNGIAAGPDGALWFGEGNANRVGRITTDGAITEYTAPTADIATYDMTLGPDGAVWFTENAEWYADHEIEQLGRITTDGAITEYPLPVVQGRSVGDLTLGPDGAFWYIRAQVDAINRITTSGDTTTYPLPTSNAQLYGITATADSIWFSEYGTAKVGRALLPSIIPGAPEHLAIPSPTSTPALTWDASEGATSYNIYRAGSLVGNSTTNNYSDTTSPEGTNDYYVTAVSPGGESPASNTVSVLVDRSAPTVLNVSLATDPLPANQTTTLSATVSDNLSGVARVEYYVGTDPGRGNGTPMATSNGVASATVGNYATAGMHTYNVRALDNVGNWGAPVSVTMDVFDPAGGYTAAHGFIVPNGATSNPGDTLPAESGNNLKATFDYTVKYATTSSTVPTGTSTFTWGSACNSPKSNCFAVNTDTTVVPHVGGLDWLIDAGDNTATFQGTASLSQGSTSLGTGYPFRISVMGTTATAPGHYKLQVFPLGADPSTAAPIYQASGDLSGGSVVMH